VHTENSEEIAVATNVFTKVETEDIGTTGEASTPKESKAGCRGLCPVNPEVSVNHP